MISTAASRASKGRRASLVAVRFLTALALGLWIGGLFFFGAMAAGPMFRVAREAHHGELAPQMVAVMLGRFGFVLLACGLMLLLGWASENWLAPPRSLWEKRLWTIQGAASATMLGIALYLGLVLMPRIRAMQFGVLHGPNSALKTQFDAAHSAYSSLAGVSIYLGFAVLLSMMWRISSDP